MGGHDLFDGLPPPASASASASSQDRIPSPSPPPPPPPTSLFPPSKSAIKRPPQDNAPEGAKRVRFKTSVEASSKQIIDAMQKIAAHIGNSGKFSKASKLALQLLQSGSVTRETADHFFEILRSSMSSPDLATEPSLRQDYHELFSAVSEELDSFSAPQQAQLQVWLLWAQVANDLFTDDTFVFSKAASRVKQQICSLPEATAAEGAYDVATTSQSRLSNRDEGLTEVRESAGSNIPKLAEVDELDSDPFGLNALLLIPSRKEERAKRKKEEEAATRKAQEDEDRLLQERREALMECLKIAAGRYKLQWAQTIIDILVKHALDNISKFTVEQRNAIEKLWGSVKEQQIRRKQGKTATGKLDLTAFERLQNEYAHVKMSIRHSVGSGGGRSAEQWLG